MIGTGAESELQEWGPVCAQLLPSETCAVARGATASGSDRIGSNGQFDTVHIPTSSYLADFAKLR
ncbi:MAG: hypothetical protein JWQ87_2613 [Candidatus Sulfotelmatobacter sp.]|nr:hypothetical protein [Candidatus Sulfotelmatobacter sp.]